MNLFKAFILTCTITLNACGAEPQIIYVYPQGQDPQLQQQQQPQTQAYPVNQPQLTNSNRQPVLQNKPNKAISATKTGTPVNTNLKTTPAKPVTNTTTLSSEDKILKKARESFEAVQSISASIKTFENGNGQDGTGQIKLLYKKPANIKVDVISSTASGQAGVKLAYSDPNNVNVRPSGMLSMVSVSLAMNDPKILSGRKYQLNQIDLPSTVMRLTQPGTKAKLVGQSSVSGSPVFVLEISNNHFDPRITREVFSIDSKTFMPRMHEMYEGTKKVYAVEISQINLNQPITLDDFKV